MAVFNDLGLQHLRYGSGFRFYLDHSIKTGTGFYRIDDLPVMALELQFHVNRKFGRSRAAVRIPSKNPFRVSEACNHCGQSSYFLDRLPAWSVAPSIVFKRA